MTRPNPQSASRKHPRAKRARIASTRRLPHIEPVATVPVTIPYVRHSMQGAPWFVAQALEQLLVRSGIEKGALDGLCLSSMTLTPDNAVTLTQHLGISPRWLESIPMGGASGVVALRRAVSAVRCGDAHVIACIAADTNQPDTFRSTLESFSRFSRDAVYPYGGGGPNASFALLTAHYMSEFGARPEDFGKLCVAQRQNALSFPHALFREALTLEEYLSARPIAEPLRLYDCVMPCAGAEGFLVMSQARAEELELAHVTVLSTLERHNAFPDDPIQTRGGWALARNDLFRDAGVRHDQVDLLQTYDDYPVISLMQIEDLGFCGKGEGPGFIRGHTLTNDGSFPHNTSGGQLSVGQAGAAGGYLGLTDAIRQLTGAALGAPVRDAKIGLVSGFGIINYDRGLCCAAAILAACRGLR